MLRYVLANTRASMCKASILTLGCLALGVQAAKAQVPGPECIKLAGPATSTAHATKQPDEKMLRHFSRIWTISRYVELMGTDSVSPTFALLVAEGLGLTVDQTNRLETVERELQAKIESDEPPKCQAQLELKELESANLSGSDQYKAIVTKVEQASALLKDSMSIARDETLAILTDVQKQSLMKLMTSPIKILPR